MSNKRDGKVRVTIYMPEDLEKKISDYADENYLNRTSAINFILNKHFKEEDAIKTLENVTKMYNAEKNK